jgi:outer membrane receptor protein involved in Fe transport
LKVWPSRLAGLAAALATVPAGGALAQSAPASPPAQPAPAKGGSAVQGVTVTAQTPDFKSSADSRSYDISKDLQTTTGSIADALRNLPSVDVDLNGVVSIRGDANIQILVDGQPSSQFKGPGAGQALLSMPAGQYERVEIMTSPSAAYSPEGSGGIINLISKKTRKAGTSGSVHAAQGTRGRWSMGATAAYKTDRLTASIDAGYRYDPQHSTDTDKRQTLDALGQPVSTADRLDVRQGALHIWYVRPSFDLTLDDKTHLNAEVHYNDFFYGTQAASALTDFDAAGSLDQVFDRDGHIATDTRTSGASATFRHSFAGDDHTFSAVLSQDRTAYDQTQTFTDLGLLPPAPEGFDSLKQTLSQTITDFKADYARPMPWQAKLKLGAEVKSELSVNADQGFLGAPSPSAPLDPSQGERFVARRQIDALYATWEQPFGKLTVLAGLRAETTRLSLNDAPVFTTDRSTSSRLYPSLNLNYQIDDAQQLRFSYSQRVERVVLDELDPFIHVETANTAFAGNPNLRDQETQVAEAGYEYKAGGAYYLATLYYKDNQHVPAPVQTLEPDGILLESPQNLAHTTAAGLELVANGHLTKTLSYNLSANYYRLEFDATALGFPGTRAGMTLSGRGSLNWQATDADLVQFSVRASGKQITPQGFTELGPLVNLGWRHKLSDTLSLFVTAQDALATYRQETFISTAALRDEVHDRGRTPAAFLGFTYTFGGAKKAEAFDYNN